jgi:hypothetical protein
MNGDWQVVRRRVAIAGCVVDAGTGKPLASAEVRVVAMPQTFQKWLQFAALPYGERWSKMLERPDRTWTRPDGLFYFMDVPDGKYGLQAAMPGSGSRFGKVEEPATVSRDAEGNIKMAFVKFALPPTLVKGRVAGAGQEAGVALARVRVKGSGERGFTDSQGHYMVAGIEPGKRTLLVSAQGYRTESQIFTLKEPGDSQTLDFTLKRENG